ncbi:uncharacterized protein LOC109722914 [Ananas comosus]|uniref:Uncharacterized protein LOC109722914 n=1 Tax=Ananas comosus TaxID=4615 RepID=A0A6P5GMU7_ANACO|nr:uncharacterized protein LOC109722914 [Ananas comosus]
MSSESVGSCGDGEGGRGGGGKREGNYENAPEERGKSPRGSREAGEGGPGPSDRRAGIDGRDFPEVACACGRGTCAVLVSRTERNPGRPFYRCPAKSASERCKFFLWCDMAGPNQQNAHNSSPAKPYQRRGIDSPVKPVAKSPTKHVQLNGPAKPTTPICSCGAGRCSILMMQNGVNSGRKYYACAIKKGQGACNHFQWLDEIAGKPPETGNADLNELKLKLASSDPVLQDNKNIGENKAPKMNCNGEAHEIDDAALMQLPLDEPPVLRSPPVSPKRQPQASDEIRTSPMKRLSLHDGTPPVSPKRQHQASDEIRTSPMKRLSLHDGVPSVPGIGKCYRCGREGHWMAECASPAVSPCFQCGKPGHWKKDCPEFR